MKINIDKYIQQYVNKGFLIAPLYDKAEQTSIREFSEEWLSSLVEEYALEPKYIGELAEYHTWWNKAKVNHNEMFY